jgi:hypothetical protein
LEISPRVGCIFVSRLRRIYMDNEYPKEAKTAIKKNTFGYFVLTSTFAKN